MIRLVVAVDQKLGISKKGLQPWNIPEDEAYFNALTKLYGGNVLVGSTTFKTFTRTLGSRTNYILTRSTEPVEGAILVNDLNVFLEESKDKDVWVIGGAAVFEQVMLTGDVAELYVTHIEADFGCTQFFPDFSKDLTLRERSEPQEQNGFKFNYAVYDKLSDSDA